MLLLKFIFLLAITGITACKDTTDDLFLEISPNSQSQVIEQELNGITFKFCLLNEQGQPATVFNEGENFSFYFSSANTSEKDFYFNAREVCYNKDFFRVYQSSGADMGKSYDPFPQTMIGIAAYPFNIGDVHSMKVPWLHEGDSIPCGGGLSYYSVFKEPLVKGHYYTNFTHSFHIKEQKSGTSVRTNFVNFKISFQIIHTNRFYPL
jgi:hypothetical protein